MGSGVQQRLHHGSDNNLSIAWTRTWGCFLFTGIVEINYVCADFIGDSFGPRPLFRGYFCD